MRAFYTFLFSLILLSAGAQVGIGTNTPSGNAMLDVSSSNKGIMLPRVNDTANVSNPSEGLIIYNRQTLSPAFHDGSKWNPIASTLLSATGDSATYTVTIPGSNPNTFVAGTYGASTLMHGIVAGTPSSGGTGAGRPTFNPVVIKKDLDANSIPFTKSAINGNTGGIILEFKFYNRTTAVLKYSIKLTTPFISTFDINIDENGKFVETIGMTAMIIGYKNWITNTSYAFNIAGNVVVAY